MEDIRRIREAVAIEASVLTDLETEQIKQQAALLGENGEATVGKILDKARELASQPADVLRMVEGYLKELNNKVMLRELSIDLEKEQAAERTTRLKVMEAEAGNLRTARRKGDMAGIMRGHGVLTAQLNEYLKNIEADEEGGVTSDPSGKWCVAALSLTNDILEKVSLYGRSVADEKEDALGLLRRVMGNVASLNEAVAKVKDAPEEEGLRVLGRRLGKVRTRPWRLKLMSWLGKQRMLSEQANR
jgi:hypothetical protein